MEDNISSLSLQYKTSEKVTSLQHLALFAGLLWFLSLNGPKI